MTAPVARGLCLAATVLIGLVPAAPGSRAGEVRLAGLGDGLALIMGGSGIPLPPPGYVDTATTLYLQPRGFTGTPQALFTPAGFYPTTGVKSLPAFVSETQGAQMLSETVSRHIAGGGVDATNPVVVFGYSQSSALSSLAMTQLADQGVPAEDVHFVLVGDTAAPNGGLLERFDVPLGSNPSIPSLGITFGHPTPDLYPTDVYTLEYDGFADFPQYPLNPLADLNAMAGMVLEHFTYLGLEPDQIANAIPLPTADADSLTHYFMIPQDHLPLLDLVRFLPFLGNPLADLVEPVMKILVNLGYGGITEGWSQGPADVETPFGLFPPDLDWGEVFSALTTAIPEGLVAAGRDLLDPRNYDVFASIADNPATGPLLRAAYAVGDLTTNPAAFLDDPNLSTFTQVFNALDLESATPSEWYTQLLPLADTFTALTVTLPVYNLTVFLDQLESGNLVEAIGLPIAADMALIPIAVALGLGLGGGL